MNFHQTIELYQKKINKALEQFFNDLYSKNNDPLQRKYIEMMKEFTLRKGKRLRPILVIIAFNGLQTLNNKTTNNKTLNSNNTNNKTLNNKTTKNNPQDTQINSDLLNVALTTELLESFFLIHDDIIDNSDLRRGKLSIHKQFEQHYNKATAQSLALLVGDLMASQALLPIFNSNIEPTIKNNLLHKVQQIIIQTNYGQIQDLLLLQTPINQVSEEQILAIYQEKTARYTLEGPLQLGAIAATASRETLQSLSKVALPLGVAFQLRDDILGLFGTVEKIGKPIDSDIKEGKKTLLILKALETTSVKNRKFLIACLGNQKVTSNDLQQIRQIVIDSDSLNYSQQLIHSLITKAKEELAKITLNQESKDFLIALADYIAAREN